MSSRPHDVVVFGATGFSGRLVARYLARVAPDLRWAIAGRSRDKLELVRDELAALAPKLAELPVLVADTDDAAAIDAIAAQTRVVCTTVGPYRKYGRGLVRACANHGTHYCDITGEVPFIRASIDDNHAVAEETGARIVHACGFDSIPSDIGVFLLFERAKSLGEELAWVKAFVTIQGRGAPGGVETALALVQDARRDRALRALTANPYALDPDPTRRGPDAADQLGVRFDRDFDQWTAPFVMARINTRVVRRTASLVGYGEQFHYEESMCFGKGARGFAKATAMTGGVGVFVAMAYFQPMHGMLRRLVHSDRARDGFYRVQLLGQTTSGRRLVAHASGDGDAGCEPTAMMLAESALSLAHDTPARPRAGVLTPASAMGEYLVGRVRAGGMTLQLDEPSMDRISEPVPHGVHSGSR